MGSTCGHETAPRLTGDGVDRALARAQAICESDGHRWTEPRRRVFEMLILLGGPAKAYDLMHRYAEGQPAKPPTIYRALEFLERIGLVHRIASLNAYIACDVDASGHVAAFLICDCCGSAEEFAPGSVKAATSAAVARGFASRTVSLEVRGSCSRCSGSPLATHDPGLGIAT